MRPTERVHGRAGVTATILGSVAATVLVFASLASASDRGVLQVPFTVRGSVEQVDVTGANPGQRLKLVDSTATSSRRSGGSLGGIVFRNVEPGGGYRVREGGRHGVAHVQGAHEPARSAEHEDLQPDAPAGGYGYLTTRDGTKLAINVHLPGPRRRPLPDPDRVLRLRLRRSRRAARARSSRSPTLLGFAVVDVNMRGTGCSGGAFDYFEPLQALDGYDVIETVARQPWVLHHKVGMMGVSYGGISQLFVGATRPPNLAAIAPLSVIDNTPDDALSRRHPQHRLRAPVGRGPRPRRAARVADRRPGVGLRADPGRRHDLQGQPGPAPRGGQPDREDRAQPLLPPEGRRPALADHLRPQDQRARLPRLPVDRRADRRPLPDLPSQFTGTDRKWFTFTNGVHIDSLDPRHVQPLVRLPRALRGAAESRS